MTRWHNGEIDGVPVMCIHTVFGTYMCIYKDRFETKKECSFRGTPLRRGKPHA